jgi:hypothetical protein
MAKAVRAGFTPHYQWSESNSRGLTTRGRKQKLVVYPDSDLEISLLPAETQNPNMRIQSTDSESGIVHLYGISQPPRNPRMTDSESDIGHSNGALHEVSRSRPRTRRHAGDVASAESSRDGDLRRGDSDTAYMHGDRGRANTRDVHSQGADSRKGVMHTSREYADRYDNNKDDADQRDDYARDEDNVPTNRATGVSHAQRGHHDRGEDHDDEEDTSAYRQRSRIQGMDRGVDIQGMDHDDDVDSVMYNWSWEVNSCVMQ